jgi:hypothetical protein
MRWHRSEAMNPVRPSRPALETQTETERGRKEEANFGSGMTVP